MVKYRSHLASGGVVPVFDACVEVLSQEAGDERYGVDN
jgi:hypothetical protein